MLYNKETFYTIVSPPAALEIIYLDYLCNVFECIICKMSQKDQPSINYPVCVIDETDELRTDFKIGTFLTKQTRFLLILGKSSSRLYNRSSTQTLPWVSTLLNLIPKSWKIHPEFFRNFSFSVCFTPRKTRPYFGQKSACVMLQNSKIDDWTSFPDIGVAHCPNLNKTE